jgi:hypothetical protein
VLNLLLQLTHITQLDWNQLQRILNTKSHNSSPSHWIMRIKLMVTLVTEIAMSRTTITHINIQLQELTPNNRLNLLLLLIHTTQLDLSQHQRIHSMRFHNNWPSHSTTRTRPMVIPVIETAMSRTTITHTNTLLQEHTASKNQLQWLKSTHYIQLVSSLPQRIHNTRFHNSSPNQSLLRMLLTWTLVTETVISSTGTTQTSTLPQELTASKSQPP